MLPPWEFSFSAGKCKCECFCFWNTRWKSYVRLGFRRAHMRVWSFGNTISHHNTLTLNRFKHSWECEQFLSIYEYDPMIIFFCTHKTQDPLTHMCTTKDVCDVRFPPVLLNLILKNAQQWCCDVYNLKNTFLTIKKAIWKFVLIIIARVPREIFIRRSGEYIRTHDVRSVMWGYSIVSAYGADFIASLSNVAHCQSLGSRLYLYISCMSSQDQAYYKNIKQCVYIYSVECLWHNSWDISYEGMYLCDMNQRFITSSTQWCIGQALRRPN